MLLIVILCIAIGFGIGLFSGMFLSARYVAKWDIGILRWFVDKDDNSIYFSMDLDKYPKDIIKRKHVILRVDDKDA